MSQYCPSGGSTKKRGISNPATLVLSICSTAPAQEEGDDTVADAVAIDGRGPVAGWEEALGALHQCIARQFRLTEACARVRRKHGWQMVEHLGEPGPQGIQRPLNAAAWDADAVRAGRRASVVEALGTSEGLLILDETGYLKKGTKAVGVQRQYPGTAGRREHCQVGVLLANATTRGCAFLDRALDMPEV